MVKDKKKREPFSENFLFLSRYAGYRVVLYPEVVNIMANGNKHVGAPTVIAEFRGGRFILDDSFRRKHYRSRKLTDGAVLRRMMEIDGYGSDFWFAMKLDNKEAKNQKDALRRIFEEDKPYEVKDEKMKELLEDVDGSEEAINNDQGVGDEKGKGNSG